MKGQEIWHWIFFPAILRKTGCSDVFPYYKLTDLTVNRKQQKQTNKENKKGWS